MRIAMVTSVESDIPVVDLSGALSDEGHEVAVHSARVVPHGDGPGEWLQSFVTTLREQWSDSRPEIVHTHSWTAGLAALFAAQPLDIPVVHTFHDITHGPSGRLDVERAVCRGVARVVAMSGGELPTLLRLGVKRSKIAVVPYGVDHRRFAPEGPLALRGSTHRLVTAAPNGLPVELVAALRSLPEAELLVLDGPPSVDELAARLGVADRVVRLATVADHLPLLFRSADIVVCGPWCDRPSVLAVQAMACRVAVVSTTTTGGMADVVVDRVTGMIPDQRGPAGLTRLLGGLLADHARRESYAVAGSDRALARYGIDRAAGDIAGVYASAVHCGLS
ncbi:glycosyltransferase [Actinosynnema sp. NPDC023587]|uniref:glycosyltransferase n=1 Tax=Actinosynnema sp. NPDC023587 TaxID=3154695 RepID=UPI0033E755DD